MKRIVAQLKDEGRVLVSDGAWGTLMQQRGLQPGECPDLWSITHRAAVLEIAASYVDAGADMIESNSFGANRFKLEHFGLQERAAEINEAAAAISREAAGPDRHVIASVGPTGKLLLMNEVPADALYAAFKEQFVALERGGADACCIETFTAIDEAALAVRAARENTHLEILVTFTFEQSRQGGYRTMMGVSPADMANAMIEAGADVIGTNCGNGMERMADIVRELRRTAPATPILVQANAGMPVEAAGKTVFPESPEIMARHAIAVVEAGANIVGGCCGTTPAHIRAIARMLKRG